MRKLITALVLSFTAVTLLDAASALAEEAPPECIEVVLEGDPPLVVTVCP